MVEFEYKGKAYECDEAAAKDYKVIKAIAKSKDNPAALFDGFERIFAGRDEEYAESVGGIGGMVDLFAAALKAVGDQAKN